MNIPSSKNPSMEPQGPHINKPKQKIEYRIAYSSIMASIHGTKENVDLVCNNLILKYVSLLLLLHKSF